jgi:hypothetical protein
MTKEQAIEIAKSAARIEMLRVYPEPDRVVYTEKRMQLGRKRKGWIVAFRIIQEGDEIIDPAVRFIEIYEPDGDINILPL